MHQDELFGLEDNDGDRIQDIEAMEGCSFDSCDRPFYARWKKEVPYCKTHYEQARQGKPLRPIRKMLTRGTYVECQFTGCGLPHSSGGYCDGHYQQDQKGGPLKPLRSWISQAEWGGRCRYGTCEDTPHSRGLCVAHYGRGISQFARDAIFALQNNCCGICGKTEPGDTRGWHLDHAHECDGGHKPVNYCVKCVRGLLCLNCNRHGLAWYENNYRHHPSNPLFPLLEEWIVRRIKFHGAVDSPDVTVSYLSRADGSEQSIVQHVNEARPR
ncbi:endonuclease domain-containing protein [Streptomyces flaveolus]|uniref:endonuclease domain-containing protein n=1 Tax=Streptomyces flaveolus TaxID=67297 RepID=UPI0037F7D602